MTGGKISCVLRFPRVVLADGWVKVWRRDEVRVVEHSAGDVMRELFEIGRAHV